MDGWYSEMLKRLILLNLFFLTITAAFSTTTRFAFASDWQIIDYQNGRGAIATNNIFIQNAKIPAWASLSVDFGIGRRCFGGLGLTFRTAQNLGRATKQYKDNMDTTIYLNIDGQDWEKNVRALVIYENGFEGFIEIDEQSLMNALMINSGEALLTYKYQNQARARVAFSLRGSRSAIRGAYERCKAKM